MLLKDKTEEAEEQDADEPLREEADSLLCDELELPPELIGVPLN
jgi:hypothetical protein